MQINLTLVAAPSVMARLCLQIRWPLQ